MNNKLDKFFELYDLEIIVEEILGNCTCSMSVGDKFQVSGGKISLPKNKNFCLYALQSTLPLIPAKQRKNESSDWIETDSRVTCPDPACKLIMRIDRIGTQVFHHNDVSSVQLE